MTGTLIEMLAKLPTRSRQNEVLTALYFDKHFGSDNKPTSSEIRSALLAARVSGAKKMNVADVLGKAAPYAHSVSKSPQGYLRWELTATGDEHIRGMLGLPAVGVTLVNKAAALDTVASRIKDDDSRHFIEEAILCLRADARRASIVFTWVAAARELQDRVWSHGAKLVNAAAVQHNPKAKTVSKRDDLSELNEALLLQVAHDLGVIDKNEKQMLDQCLVTRNSCGHPNKYRPGVAKVESHIEDIVGILFS